MDLNGAKNYGCVGAILIFVSPILVILPYGEYLGLLSAVVGIGFELVAMSAIAKVFGDGGIIRNSRLGILLQAVGLAAILIAFLVSTYVFSNALASQGINMNNLSDVENLLNNSSFLTENMNLFFSLAEALIAGYIALVALLIVGSYFLRKSLVALSSKTRVGLFGTASFAMLIGSFLSILIIGLLIVWVAWLLIAFAFLRIKPGWAPAYSGPSAPVQPSVPWPSPPSPP